MPKHPKFLLETANQTPSRTIKDYFAELGTKNAANVMIDISELNHHFLIDLDAKEMDKAISFNEISKIFANTQGIKFIHENSIRIDNDCFNQLITAIQMHQQKNPSFNQRLNVFLLTHGGPSWFFGPVEEYFREKIGMVIFDYEPPLTRLSSFFSHGHFILTPSKLYFVPKDSSEIIDCWLDVQTHQKAIDVFSSAGIREEFGLGPIYRIPQLLREELNAIVDWVDFDIDIHENEQTACIYYPQFSKKNDPLHPKRHFVMTTAKFFYYDGERYTECKKITDDCFKTLRQLLSINLAQYKKISAPVIIYQIMPKYLVQKVKDLLGNRGITWSKVPFRSLDFIAGERDGSVKVINILNNLTQATNTSINNVVLHSCFSAAEFSDLNDQNAMFSSARLFSLFLRDTNVIGCVGLNADIKASKLCLQSDLGENLTIPRHYNITDTLVCYRSGNVVKDTRFAFALKSEGSYFKNLGEILFNNNVPPMLCLNTLDSLFQKVTDELKTEVKRVTFAQLQVDAYPKMNP
jgi:hypothetical protein